MRYARFAALAMSALCSAAPVAALAQAAAANFPSKLISIVLPFPPGANADLEARVYQEGLQAQLKQTVVIDYKPGGAGVIAGSFVAKAAPDGHTLGFINSSSTLLPALRKNLPYDLARDFVPVVMTTENITVLLVTPSLPVQTFEEWVAYAKARPGEVTWSTVGSGGGFHVGGEWLAGELGIKLTFVHYKGGGQAEVDLLAGRIHSTPKQLPPSLPLIRSGKARVIAVLTRDRTPLLPGIKTVAEMGAPNFSYPSWIGLVAPAGTPAPIVDKINAAMVTAIKSPQALKRWEAQGSVAVGSTPEAFRKRILTEMAQWDKVVKEKNIKEE